MKKLIYLMSFMLLFSFTSYDANVAEKNTEMNLAMYAFQKLETSGDDWSNKLFTVDTNTIIQYEPYDLAVSDIITNNSGAENIDVIVRFDSVDPGQAVSGNSISYWIFVYVEEEISINEWSIIAESFGQRYGDLTNGPKEAKFIIQTRNTSDQGQPFSTSQGFKWYVNESPSEKLRVRVEVIENNTSSPARLVSANITGSYRLY